MTRLLTRGRLLGAGALSAAVLVAAPFAFAQGPQFFAGDRTPAVRQAVKDGPARNVILFIGDGMGDSEITAARNYEHGAAGRLALDELPLTGSYTTYSVQKGDPGTPNYVPDSAATGSAWATGSKTYNGAISVDAHGNPLPTLLENAKRAGLRTGNVTTAELQDATPAVLGSHVVDRDCKGPQSMQKCPANAKENGGAGSIAEQLVQTAPDVLLGGGKKYFDQTVQAGEFKGRTVLDQAKQAGYDLVTDRAGLQAARADRPLLGLFAGGNMEVQWTGPGAKVGGTDPTRCEANPKLPAAAPKLAEMTGKAIELLDQQQGRGKGFFLQVEGASIDKQDHAANPCGQIGETVGLDEAVKVATDYAKSHPETLVLISADHGHTSQIIPNDAKSPGQTATLITNEGVPMTMNYATNTPGESQEHTGTQVRVAGMGPGAANIVGLTDQTDIFRTISRALGLR
ncbi:alkaline phosphatase [Saccharopolyspora shandongensis]|uniref:alkaline phosphatase n=1 Tax=Saccharopolyspora shandongensis TaxID=418495 RepID=UPI003442E4BD